MQIPVLRKSFSDILEYSGMSIGDFSTVLNAPKPALPQPQPAQPVQQPSIALSPQTNEQAWNWKDKKISEWWYDGISRQEHADEFVS